MRPDSFATDVNRSLLMKLMVIGLGSNWGCRILDCIIGLQEKSKIMKLEIIMETLAHKSQRLMVANLLVSWRLEHQCSLHRLVDPNDKDSQLYPWFLYLLIPLCSTSSKGLQTNLVHGYLRAIQLGLINSEFGHSSLELLFQKLHLK